jgi:hypothetical protein
LLKERTKDLLGLGAEDADRYVNLRDPLYPLISASMVFLRLGFSSGQ